MCAADRDPWSYHPRFVAGSEELFAAVRDDVAWTSQMKSRQTASMGIPYNYAGASYPENAWHPGVRRVADEVEHVFGFAVTNCLLNRYPTGEHTIGWHADDVAILAPGTGIVIVSLGATRTMLLRTGEAGGWVYERIALAAGSALFMSEGLQATHKHGIKREQGATERISLTFRHLTHAPPPVDAPRWSSVTPAGRKKEREV